MTNENKGMLLGLIATTAFALTLPFTRLIVPYLHPLFIGFGRAVVAALLALIFLLATKQPFPEKKHFLSLGIISLGVIFGFPLLSAWAMKWVPASHGAIVLAILPLTTSIAGALVAGERPSPGFWLLGTTGSFLVAGFALLEGAGTFHWADLALLGAILSASIGYAFSAQLSRHLGGWQVISWALVLSFPLLLPPALLFAPSQPLQLPLFVWGGFLYLALISQYLSFFAWNRGLLLGGIARVSQTQLLQPFITLGASALLLSESVPWHTYLFASLVAITVALGKKMPIRRKD